MAILELNIRAKQKALGPFNKQRRNDMAKWRKQKKLQFNSSITFMDWLDYTKWYKRPHTTAYVKHHLGMWNILEVTFLDNMKGAK